MKSTSRYVSINAGVFIASSLLGYVAAVIYPAEARSMVTQALEGFSFLEGASDLSIFLFIFFNNSIKAFFAIILGLSLVIPLIFMFLNGFLLGMVLNIFGGMIGAVTITATLAPHGILEIPAVILAAGYGLWLGTEFWKGVLKNDKSVKLSELFSVALKKYVKIVVPMLFIASIIETFVSPYVAGLLR